MKGLSIPRRRFLQGVGAGSVGAVAFGGAIGKLEAGNGSPAQPPSGGSSDTTGKPGGQPQSERHIVGTATKEATAQARREAESVHRVLDFGDIGHAVAGVFSTKALERLHERPGVRYIEVDGLWDALEQTLPWGIDRVDAEMLHSNGKTGTGAHVAIIDTGIDSDHPDLQANLGTGKAYVTCRGGGCKEPWDDDNGHGTHCAGIADAVNNTIGVVGVSTAATLHALKVLANNGSGSWSNVAAAIKDTADNGWEVGSLSLGGGHSSTVRDACQYAADRGVLLVAAAGNSGPCTNCVSYPAKYPTVMAVSSTTKTDALSSFSSTGPEIELAAPGSGIYSTVVDGYASKSGTSMACPHVSGAAAQLMAGGKSRDETRTTLKSSAEPLSGLTAEQQGAGLLDAEKAVLGTTDGNNLGGTAPSVLAVSTKEATSVTDATATLNGELTDLGGASSADVSFTWQEQGTEQWVQTPTQQLTTTGAFNTGLSGLTGSTTYEFYAVASTSTSTVAGSTLTFTTAATSGGHPPAINRFEIVDRSNRQWSRFDVDWAVSDQDGDLLQVVLTLIHDQSRTADQKTIAVSGSNASGVTTLQERFKSGRYDVRLDVYDNSGSSPTTDTKIARAG